MCTLFIDFWANVFDDSSVAQPLTIFFKTTGLHHRKKESRGLTAVLRACIVALPFSVAQECWWGSQGGAWGPASEDVKSVQLGVLSRAVLVLDWQLEMMTGIEGKPSTGSCLHSYPPPHPPWLLKGVREKGLRCRKYFAFPYKLCCDTAFLLGCWEQRACLAQGEGWHQKNFT